jgi:hypothetical protein
VFALDLMPTYEGDNPNFLICFFLPVSLSNILISASWDLLPNKLLYYFCFLENTVYWMLHIDQFLEYGIKISDSRFVCNLEMILYLSRIQLYHS